MIKSYYPKAAEINRQWLLVDANGETLGRLATKIAGLLLGKHKPTFTPGVELGDFVIVINAQKITVTGTKTHTKLTEKFYHSHSGYPGGLKTISCVTSWQTILTALFAPQSGECCRITRWATIS